MADNGWVCLMTKFPERAKMGQGASVGSGKYPKFGKTNDTVAPTHILMADTKGFYFIFQEPLKLLDRVIKMVEKVEAKWVAKNKGRPAGSRNWPEERSMGYYYPPSMDHSRSSGTFLLLVASTWHFTSEVQYESGQPRFNQNKVRIQLKAVSRNFNTASMMMEGGAYMFYNDFKVLAKSAELSLFLDRLAEVMEEDKDYKFEEELKEQEDWKETDEYKSEVAHLKSLDDKVKSAPEVEVASGVEDDPAAKKRVRKAAGVAGGSKRGRKTGGGEQPQ